MATDTDADTNTDTDGDTVMYMRTPGVEIHTQSRKKSFYINFYSARGLEIVFKAR
jgi:hypothetical protein